MDSPYRIISWNGLKIIVPGPCQEIIHAPTHLLIEADYQPVLEIRWQRQGKGSGRSSPESVFREISRQKNSGCSRTQLPPPLARFAQDNHAIGIQWAEQEGDLGIIWKCRTCETIVFCHLYQHPAFPIEQIAEALTAIECCSRDNKFSHWALQDFRLTIPARFLYHNSYFGAGLTKLTFQDKDQVLHLFRLAPASEKLNEKPVRDILCTLNERFSVNESICQENDNTLECHTSPSVIAQLQYRLRRKKAFCFGTIRHDETSNRLLGIIAESNRPIDPEPVRDILHHYEIIQ